jgi:hypothetical protein
MISVPRSGFNIKLAQPHRRPPQSERYAPDALLGDGAG